MRTGKGHETDISDIITLSQKFRGKGVEIQTQSKLHPNKINYIFLKMSCLPIAVYEETGELKTSASAVRGGSVHGFGHSSSGSIVGASEYEFDNETYVDKQEKDND